MWMAQDWSSVLRISGDVQQWTFFGRYYDSLTRFLLNRSTWKRSSKGILPLYMYQILSVVFYYLFFLRNKEFRDFTRNS